MNNTDINVQLIEIIKPKVAEIADAFLRGAVLDNFQVQMLLLCAIQAKFDDRFYEVISAMAERVLIANVSFSLKAK